MVKYPTLSGTGTASISACSRTCCSIHFSAMPPMRACPISGPVENSTRFGASVRFRRRSLKPGRISSRYTRRFHPSFGLIVTLLRCQFTFTSPATGDNRICFASGLSPAPVPAISSMTSSN